MKSKLLLLGIFLAFLFGYSNSAAQMDARKLPHFLSTDWYNESRVKVGKFIYKYTELPPMTSKEKPVERIQADGFEIVNISGTSGHQSETWIAYDPTNPNIIIVSANDYRYNYPGAGYRMGAYYTNDRGKTWKVSATPRNVDYPYITYTGNMTNFDPGLAFDTKGNVYYCYGYCQVTDEGQDENGIFVCRSEDGGKTWGDPNPVALSTGSSQFKPFHDRYSIACDFNPNSPYKDRIYVTWQRFIQSPGVCISYSTDSGEMWSVISSVPGGSGNTQSPVPSVGPDGELYVVWQSRNSNGTTDAVVQKSINGGKNWWTNGKVVQTVRTLGTVNTQSGRNVLMDKQNMRVSSVANLAVDCSDGPRRGWVYVVQAGRDNSSMHKVFFTKSSDGGNTWTTTKRIDDNPLGNDIFFPSITVDPVTGLVAVLYYSSQNDTENKGMDAYLAVSFDGGETFKNIRITPTTWYIRNASDVSYQGTGNYYYGDYTSITSYNGKIFPCFWMPSVPNGNFNYVASYVALMSTGPKPPENVTAENNYQEPSKVILKWYDPTHNQLGGLLGNFKIAVYKGDLKIAEVNKGTQTYTDNSAEDGKEYVYQLKTVTENDGESNFVSISGVAGGGLQPLPPVELVAKPNVNGILLQWTNPNEHTDNSFFHDFNKVNVYLNGAESPSKVIEGQAIQAGQRVTEVIDVQVDQFYTLKITAVGKRGETYTESEQSVEILAYSGAPLTDLFENFDDLENLVPRYTTSNWALTDIVSASDPNCITDSPEGNYPDRTTDSLIFAPVVVTPELTTLSFDHIAIIDKNDLGFVSISNDFGQTWNNILYVDITRSAGFTDDVLTSEWFSEHRDLSDYIGDTIFIKFTLSSNPFRNKDGWYIDNLRIDDDPNSVEEIIAADNNFEVVVYPNPISNNANINLITTIPGNAFITIYDAIGNQVMNVLNDKIYAGINSFNLDLTKFNESVYYCNVKFNGKTKTLPIVIVR